MMSLTALYWDDSNLDSCCRCVNAQDRTEQLKLIDQKPVEICNMQLRIKPGSPR